MFNDKQNKMMLEVIDLLERADMLLQAAMGASDECYEIHCAIECAIEDVLDVIKENNPEEPDA